MSVYQFINGKRLFKSQVAERELSKVKLCLAKGTFPMLNWNDTTATRLLSGQASQFWFKGLKEWYLLYRLGPSSRQKDSVNVASSSKNSVAKASHHKLSLS